MGTGQGLEADVLVVLSRASNPFQIGASGNFLKACAHPCIFLLSHHQA